MPVVKIESQLAYKPGSVQAASAAAMAIHLGRLSPGASSNQPGRRCGNAFRSAECRAPMPSLFGFAPSGVYHASAVASAAVRSYRTLSPLPARSAGGFLSVALSLGLPLPEIIRRRVSVEPGLSSTQDALQPQGPQRAPQAAAIRPTGFLCNGASFYSVKGFAGAPPLCLALAAIPARTISTPPAKAFSISPPRRKAPASSMLTKP